MDDMKGILFDKDGTLFDFSATWDRWGADLISRLSGGSAELATALAHALHYDLARSVFRPDSPVIAGSGAEVTALIADAMGAAAPPDLEPLLNDAARDAPLAEAVPLAPLMARLRSTGLKLGVCTNDSEDSARAHLRRAGIGAAFDFVAGYDSGHGAKPDASPLLAFAEATGLSPAGCVMVGDSTHDLAAAREAGFRAVAVLTGPADFAELAPLAEAVLPDIGHLEDWLARRNGPEAL